MFSDKVDPGVVVFESAVGKMLYGNEKPWLRMKKPNRKGTPRLCCWICIFVVTYVVLACPGLDSFDRKYESLKFAASLEQDELDACSGRRIYMYDLPPAFNVDVHNMSRCNHSLIPWMNLCARFTNGGYGIRLSNRTVAPSSKAAVPVSLGGESDDLFDRSDFYDTDSYMLEMMFHSRLQKYRCLTNHTALADAFYVPFYTGLVALDYLYGSQNVFEKRAKYGSELLAWLDKNAGYPWRRFEGRDHFMIMGRTTWDFTLHPFWGTGFSALPYVTNMTNLMLERRVSLENEQAIPYPTSFHPDSPERLHSWIENVKTTRRKYLFSYVGAPRPDSWSVRGIMGASCINAGESVCNLVNCSIARCSHDPIPIYTSFLQSNFCLQPRGDTSTRRSTFDCLISGSIPVFFHRDTAYTQYSWHLPEDPDSYSVYIDESEIKRGKSIHAVLMSYSPERIRRMRRTIVSIIPNLLYNAYENDDQSGAPKDAFELSIEKLLARIAGIRKELVRSYRCWIPFRPRNCFLA